MDELNKPENAIDIFSTFLQSIHLKEKKTFISTEKENSAEQSHVSSGYVHCFLHTNRCHCFRLWVRHPVYLRQYWHFILQVTGETSLPKLPGCHRLLPSAGTVEILGPVSRRPTKYRR